MSKYAKKKILVYAAECGCLIREEGGLCWRTPVFQMGGDGKYDPSRRIEFVGQYGAKVAVRDSKKGIVCL